MHSLQNLGYALLAAAFGGMNVVMGVRGIKHKKMLSRGIPVAGLEAVLNGFAYIAVSVLAFAGAIVFLLR